MPYASKKTIVFLLYLKKKDGRLYTALSCKKYFFLNAYDISESKIRFYIFRLFSTTFVCYSDTKIYKKVIKLRLFCW